MENSEEQNEEKTFLRQNKTSRPFSPLLRQILASSCSIFLSITLGMTMGYSAILLPQLEQQNSTFKITMNQGSWIASMIGIPSAVGGLLAGFLMERIGRKLTQVSGAVICTMGWISIGAAQNMEMIIAGRLLTGMAFGILGPTSNIYIGETTAPKYRGFLLSAVSVGIAAGIFLSHLFGMFLSWQMVAYLSLAPCLAIITNIFVPESPIWLVNQGKKEKAQEAFEWCRGYAIEESEEFAAMLEKQKTSKREKVSWSQYTRREFWEPLTITAVLVITMQFSGVSVITFYTISLMQDAVAEGVNEYTAMMIIDTMRLIMSVVGFVLVRKFGRRPLNNISVLGTTTSLFCLSGFLYCSTIYPEIAKYSSVSLVCLVNYIIFTSVGLVQLPWIVMGEVFPRNMRSAGGALITATNFICLFLVVKMHPIMNLHIQQYGCFFVYGCLTGIGGIFLYFYLPETKGKTLQEIEEYFRNKRVRKQQKINVSGA